MPAVAGARRKAKYVASWAERAQVRESATFIAARATHVTVDADAVAVVAQHWVESGLLRCRAPFDRTLHYVDESEPAATLQYLFFVDALNWCFWPDADAATASCPPFEYEHLAGGLKRALETEPSCLSADKLASCDGPGLRALLGWPRPLPCEEERARVLRQTAAALARSFGGSAAHLVARAGGSASSLCALLTAHFPAFRDAALYRGRQVFFLKRAQIFAADVYAAFDGAGPGAFHDVAKLTSARRAFLIARVSAP